MDLCNPSYVKELLAKYGLAPKKGFGQNFLINTAVPEKIAQASSSFAPSNKPKGVLEIGPGVGALTQYLAEEYDKVVAVEIDNGLIPLLAEVFGDNENVEIVNTDFMKLDLPAFMNEHFGDIIADGGSVGVCANLPYYITTPVIMKLLESYPASERLPYTSIVVMVQLEVARRLASKAGKGDYGSVTASVSLRADVTKLFDVSAGNFHPVPKVASAVIGIIPNGGITEVYPECGTDADAFASRVSDVIAAAFNQRRKTLVNALSGIYPKDKTVSVLSALGIREDVRGEALSPREFCLITDALSNE